MKRHASNTGFRSGDGAHDFRRLAVFEAFPELAAVAEDCSEAEDGKGAGD